jgi:single-stranded DNA-binding protein
MTEASVSFADNLTEDPEVRYTEARIARAMFRVAVSGRGSRRRRSSPSSSGATRPSTPPSPSPRAAGVVVIGRLQQRSWTAEDGSAWVLKVTVRRRRGSAPGSRPSSWSACARPPS